MSFCFSSFHSPASGSVFAAEKNSYPSPRFPSYTKAPKSIDEVMPFARSIASQTTGLQGGGFGMVKKGEAIAIVLEATADDMIVEAVKKAIEERGVKVQLLHDYELVGVSRAEAAELLKARRQFTAEQGYIEARQWIDGRFADPEVPKKWLKERRPDLYDALYPARAQLPERLKEAQKKLDRENIGKGIKDYLEKNPQGQRFFLGQSRDNDVETLRAALRREIFGRDGFRQSLDGDEQDLAISGRCLAFGRRAHHRADRLGGSFGDHRSRRNQPQQRFNRRYVGALGARRLPARTSLHVPQSSHGPIPVFRRRISGVSKEMEPALADAEGTGVIAGTANHAGHFPRTEVIIKDGYVADVRGSGVYAEAWREFLKYPKINEVTYPYHDRPGYWLLYEAALGTNPKFYKRPDENQIGDNVTERNRSGVMHYGHGIRVHHGPDSPEWSKEWVEFTKKNNMPDDHWFHIHNYFTTYKLRVRGTKNTWVTIISKGRMSSLDSPEVRALTSRYGDPKELLRKIGYRKSPASTRRVVTKTTLRIRGKP